jgi:hypothetical protein
MKKHVPLENDHVFIISQLVVNVYSSASTSKEVPCLLAQGQREPNPHHRVEEYLTIEHE